MKKIILYNLSFVALLIIGIELIFGYWFNENNFGIHMRKHRNQHEIYEVKINDQNYKFVYKRNFYGFRGEEFTNLSKIKYVFLGGSTGNERFLPEDLTIVGKLNLKLKNNDYKKIHVYNASVDGKTLRGHANDFKYWFTKLNNFKPEYFIIYVGINDSVLTQDLKYDLTFGKKNYRKILDYLSNNSILVELLNKIIWKYSNSVKLKYEINNSDNIYENNFNYTNYVKAKKIHNFYELKNKYSTLYQRYNERLNDIIKQSYKFNSKIIFITQVKYNGLKDEKLFLLNEMTKKFSEMNNIKIIKLDEIYNGEINDFYDPVHTSEQGSNKISNIIFTELTKIFLH